MRTIQDTFHQSFMNRLFFEPNNSEPNPQPIFVYDTLPELISAIGE